MHTLLMSYRANIWASVLHGCESNPFTIPATFFSSAKLVMLHPRAGAGAVGRSIRGASSLHVPATPTPAHSWQGPLHWQILIPFFLYFFPLCMVFPNNNLWYLWNLITFCNCVKMSAYRLVMDCWLQEFTQKLGIHHSLFEWCGKASESNNIFTFPWLINWPFKNFLKLLSKTKFCTWGIERFLSYVLSA